MIFESVFVPDWFWYLVAAGLGLIIGSFLNVYIYRFHTGKSLAGRSHCLSCATHLRWFELVPVLSYLGLQGRCRTCSSTIPIRYALVELLTATLFVAVLTVASHPLVIGLLWLAMAILVVILVYDMYHFVIPDALTAAFVITIMTLYGYWWWVGDKTLIDIATAFGAALLGASFFYVLWKISAGRWLGFGDVKLAVPLGLLVGPMLVFSFIVSSFWIGAAVSISVLLIQSWRRGKSHLRFLGPKLTMKSEVPFAPFLIAGALLTFFFSFDVLTLFTW